MRKAKKGKALKLTTQERITLRAVLVEVLVNSYMNDPRDFVIDAVMEGNRGINDYTDAELVEAGREFGCGSNPALQRVYGGAQ